MLPNLRRPIPLRIRQWGLRNSCRLAAPRGPDAALIAPCVLCVVLCVLLCACCVCCCVLLCAAVIECSFHQLCLCVCTADVTSDCGAENDVVSNHHFASPTDAVRDILHAGTDTDW